MSFEEELNFATNEFEEDGLENLSSEGNEWDDSSYSVQQPIPNLSRNNEIGNKMHFRTDKPNNSRNHFANGEFLSNKFTQSKATEEPQDDMSSLYKNTRDMIEYKRQARDSNQDSNSKCSKNQLNRSRNKLRNNDVNDMNLATSSILSDKLRDTLATINSQGKTAKRYAKNLKNLEKEMDQEKLKQKTEIKQKVIAEGKNKQSINDKKTVN